MSETNKKETRFGLAWLAACSGSPSATSSSPTRQCEVVISVRRRRRSRSVQTASPRSSR